MNVEDIRSLLGMFGVDSLRAVSDAVSAQNGAAMLEIVAELERTGQSLQHFSRELSRYWRNLLVAKLSGTPTRLITAYQPEQLALLETARQCSEEDLTRYLKLSLDLYKDLQYSLQPRLHLELGLVKLVQASKLQSIEDALAGLGKPEATVPKNPVPSVIPPVASGSLLTATARASSPKPPAFQAPPPPKPAALPPSDKPAATPGTTVAVDDHKPLEEPSPNPTGLQQGLHDALRTAGMEYSADAIQQSEVQLQGGDLVLRVPKMAMLSLKDKKVQEIAAQVIGRPVRIRLELGEAKALPQSNSTAESVGSADSDLRERALSHPGVKRFQELFPGAQIRAVRNLNE